MPTLQNTKYNKTHIDVRHKEKLLDELRTVHAALYEKYLDGSFFEVLHALGLTATADRTGNITGIYVDTDKCDVNRVLHLLTQVIAPYVRPGGYLVFTADPEVLVVRYTRDAHGGTVGRVDLLDEIPNTFLTKESSMTTITSQVYVTEEISVICRKSDNTVRLRLEALQDDIAVEACLTTPKELEALIEELVRVRDRLRAEVQTTGLEEAGADAEDGWEEEASDAEASDEGIAEEDPAEFDEENV